MSKTEESGKAEALMIALRPFQDLARELQLKVVLVIAEPDESRFWMAGNPPSDAAGRQFIRRFLKSTDVPEKTYVRVDS